MTLTQLLADAYRRLNYQSSPAADVTTRLTAYANETHRAILSTPGLDSLRDDTITVACVANQAMTGLPESVARIKTLQDRANQVLLREITLQEIRRRDPGLSMTGNPWAFARVGFRQVAAQPSTSGSGVWAVSSAAADTTQKVNLQAMRSGGYTHTPSQTTLNGTTRVAIGSPAQTDYIEITRFFLDVVATGDVTLYDASSSGNVLAVIPKGQLYVRYLAIHWYPVPATALTYTLDYTRHLQDLVQGTDEPHLPPDFHDLIGLGIRMKEYEKTDDDRYAAVASAYVERLNALRSFVQGDATQLLSLRARPQRWSMLGGYYPADRWGGGW